MKGDYRCIKCRKIKNNPENQIGTGICPDCVPSIAVDYEIVYALKQENKPIPEQYKYLFEKTEPAKQ